MLFCSVLFLGMLLTFAASLIAVTTHSDAAFVRRPTSQSAPQLQSDLTSTID